MMKMCVKNLTRMKISYVFSIFYRSMEKRRKQNGMQSAERKMCVQDMLWYRLVLRYQVPGEEAETMQPRITDILTTIHVCKIDRKY